MNDIIEDNDIVISISEIKTIFKMANGEKEISVVPIGTTGVVCLKKEFEPLLIEFFDIDGNSLSYHSVPTSKVSLLKKWNSSAVVGMAIKPTNKK